MSKMGPHDPLELSGCPEIPKIRTPATLGPHNFAWKPPIEMKFKAKL
jgi:hypothetical protein